MKRIVIFEDIPRCLDWADIGYQEKYHEVSDQEYARLLELDWKEQDLQDSLEEIENRGLATTLADTPK